MKRKIFLILFFCLLFPVTVDANITCNDGTTSPSCSVCSQGCCSHHGGCLSSSSKRDNNYYSGTKKENSNSNNDSSDSTAWAVILFLGVPLLIGLFSGFNESEEKVSKEVLTKSGYELFCDRVDNLKSRAQVKNKIISNDTSVKYDKISFIYNNKKITCFFFAKNEVEAYYQRNSNIARFRTIGKKVVMQNVSKNSSAYSLFESGIFDYNLSATFYANDVEIYDDFCVLRKLFSFNSKKLSTRNLARSKSKIENAEQYEFRVIIKKINHQYAIEIKMNLLELIRFSKLCQSIDIIENQKELVK